MSENGELTANQLQAMSLRIASAIAGRASLAAGMGTQFGGKRDLFNTLGYPRELSLEDYEARYERDGLSARIVDKPPKDTWREPPVIHDGDKNGPTDTGFCQALGQLADRLSLWKVCRQADQEAGLGEYAVILLGLRGDDPLKEPAPERLSAEDLIYLRAYRQAQVDIASYVTETGDPRYGRPLLYQIQPGNIGGQSLAQLQVHYSRIIHVAEAAGDDVHGRPRLKRSFNRLMDIDKVVGGGAEAVWRLINKGIKASAKEGYDTSGDTDAALEEEISAYIHQFTRWLIAEGYEIDELGTSETPDPSGIFGILVDLVAADTGIPKRLLLGSERGELASGTDEATWAGFVKERRQNFAEPVILRPFVDWCIVRGALPEPENGAYHVEWWPLFEQDAGELAETGRKKAETLANVGRSGVIELGLATVQEVRGFVDLPPTPQGETVDDMLDIEDALGEDAAE